MNAFEYINPTSLKDVPGLLNGKGDRKAVIIAGGGDLLGELKENLIAPTRIVNLKALPDLKYISHKRGKLKIGATTTLSDIAADETIRSSYTALAQAAESVASLQIRNVGTLGGNLCQRPRCWYYRDPAFDCLKKGGYTCFAVEGNNKYHAILGGGPSYIVHPSDTAPALIAMEASVEIHGPDGARKLPLKDFFVLPDDDLEQETVLRPNEVVTEIVVPKPKSGTKSLYLKFKEKESMDFALSAVAVALRVTDGVCRSARVVLGGVAPKPWPVPAADRILTGSRVTEDLASKAAEAALTGAEALQHNGYKIPLTKTLIRRAVMAAATA